MSNRSQALHPYARDRYILAYIISISAIMLIALSQPASSAYLSLKTNEGVPANVYISTIPDLEIVEANDSVTILNFQEDSDLFNNDPDMLFPMILIKRFEFFDEINTCEKFISRHRNSGRKIIFEREGILECVISIAEHSDMRSTTWLLWNIDCECFISIEVLVSPKNKYIYDYIVQPIIDNLRKQYSDPLEDTDRAAKLIANRKSLPEDAVDLTEVLRQVEDARQRSLEAGESRDELLARLREKSATNVAEAQEEEEEPEEAAPATAQSRAPSVPSDQVVFTVENGATKPIVVSFFEFPNQESNSPSRYYPNQGRSWILNDGKQQDYRLTCTPGRIVCMGSEFQFDRKSQSGVFWGVSVDAREQCPKCCLRCGGKSAAWKLTWDGQRHPPQVARDDNHGGGNAGTAQALGVILGTVAGVAGAVQNSRRAPITYDSSPSAPPRAPVWKPSGISQ